MPITSSDQADAAVTEVPAVTLRASSRLRWLTRLNSVLAGHWLFALLLLGGIGMRVVAWLAYQPALIYTDSYGYLFNIQPLNPQYLDPIGYPLFVLRPLLPIGGLGLVSAVQHVAGIGMALLVYRVALRCGVRRWLAALATAPVLLDAYQLQIEQNILSDVWLEVLLAVLLWLLVGRVKPPGPRLAAAVGLVLGVAMMVRMVAIVLIVPVALYLLVTGRQWRVPGGWRRIAARLGALLGVFLAIVVGYAGYFDHKTGYWSLSTASGNSIYGRTAEVADCSKLNLDSVLAQLCPAEPLGQRKGVNYYAHTDGDPNWPGYVPPGETKYDLQRQFAKVVIEKQPLDVAKAILTDFGKGFLPAHLVLPGDPPNWLWQFQPYFVVYTIDPNDRKTNPYTQEDGVVRQFNDGTGISLNAGLARFLSDYQSHGYTPGTLLGVFALIGIAAGFGARKTGLAGAALFTTVIGLSLLGLAAIFEFSWRYQLPALVVFPLAAALGITAFIRRRGSAVSADPAD